MSTTIPLPTPSGAVIINGPIISPTVTPQQSVAVIATLSISLSFATVVVGLRVYTKISLARSFVWEDGLSLLGWIGFVVFSGGVLYMQRTSDSGKHVYDLPEQSIQTSIQIINANTMIYAIAFCFAKLSILLQFKRLFVTVRGSVADITIKCLMWFHALFYLVLLLVCIFQCVPRSKIWDPSIAGTCININVAYIVYGTVNVFSDFMILLWPVHFIRRLQVPLQKKVALSLVFGAGLLGCFISIMRVVVSIRYPVSDDPTWNIMRIALWVVAELAAGVIIGCLPVLPRFFRHYTSHSASANNNLQTQIRSRAGYGGPSQIARPLASMHPSRLDQTVHQPGYYVELEEQQKLVKEARYMSA